MALTQNVIVNQVFVGASTANGFSFGDLRTLGFFELNEPVSLGSCFLDYRDTVNGQTNDPTIGYSTFNVGVPSTGTITPVDLTGAIRERIVEITGSGANLDVTTLTFGDDLNTNVRKTVAIQTACNLTSAVTSVGAIRATGGYKNFKFLIRGGIYGASGAGGAQNTQSPGSPGGIAIDATNPSGLAPKIEIAATGIVRAGGGGGGAGQNGSAGSPVTVNGPQATTQGSGCDSCPCPGHPGSLIRVNCANTGNPCNGGNGRWRIMTCTYQTYQTRSGGSAGQGGFGGLGRGANNFSGSLSGGGGTGGGAGQSPASPGTPGFPGGTAGGYGLPGSPGTGSGGQGGSAGYAINGPYGFSSPVAGIIEGIY
jgi:hypothetical protein